MHVTFLGNEPVAQNIKTFNFQTAQPVQYQAGQFIQMVLPHDNPDDRGIKRWFTLSSSPTEKQLSITTKFASDKSSSFKSALLALKPGETVELVEPEGDFILPEDKSLRLVFIAGGMGITPYHSMVKYLSDSGQKRDITLLYGVQSEAEACFLDVFATYGVDVQLSVNKRFTTDDLMAAIGDPVGTLVYLSGPEPMVEALDASLKQAGLPAKQLKSDYFPGYENLYSN
jgi:ferredoxin-NADP reductase